MIGKQRRHWQKALEMLEFGAMPPEGKPQPKEKDVQAAIKWIEAALYYVDCDQTHDPGRVTIQRLNRTEYNNTIRDLFGVAKLDLSKDFPSDDVGSGFDNIGDVLSISPLLLEKYVDAAEKVAITVIDAQASQPLEQRLAGAKLSSKNGRLSGDLFALASSGEVGGRFKVPVNGQYLIRIEAGAQQAGPEIARMDVRVDGKRLGSVEVKAPSDRPDAYEVKTRLTAGTHSISGAFVNDYYNPRAKNPKDRDRNLYIRSVTLVGSKRSRDSLRDAHKRLIRFVPGPGLNAEQATRKNLQRFMPRAFRRLVADPEVERFAKLASIARGRAETFERSMQIAVMGVLVSPHFLFRVEKDPDPNDSSKAHKLNDFELASRLSYFLWSSMPDDELLSLAFEKKLHEAKVLKQQVSRMLKDAKANALVTNFAGQWLNLRILEEVAPDTKQFPQFTRQLRSDMRRETEMFFAHVMRSDLSVLELIKGRFSFLNENLARHYGLSGVSGNEFRLVQLKNHSRAGVLTHGSILTLTSNPDRTSPVKRGKWIMENILGTPPPDPPPNVPELAETAKANPGASMRQQLEVHRKSPACATCHRQMDALGFGFENYDAIGRWREKENKQPIDASGELPGGARFKTPMELVQILSKQEKQFSALISEKMLTYALGRGLENFDRCAIDEIVVAMRKQGYRFSTLVTEIVMSEPFRMRRGEGKDESP